MNTDTLDANKYTLIPKTGISRKKVVWKNITITDIIFCLVIMTCCLAIIFPIPKISWFVKIVIACGLMSASSFLLIRNRVSGLRYYSYIWIFLKFLITKKKYSTKEMFNTVSKTKLTNNYINQTFNNKQHKYVLALKINGLDLLNTNYEDQIYKMDIFHDILLKNESFITLFKVDQTYDWNKNINSIFDKIDYLKNQKYSTKQSYISKLNQLDAQLDWYFDENDNANYLFNNWYIFVYGSSIKELIKNYDNVFYNFSRLFLVEKLDTNQTAKLLRSIWEPNNNYELIQKNEDSIEFEQIPPGDAKFYANQFSINNKYYSIGTLSIEKMPLTCNFYWLSKIARSNSSIIFNLNPMNKDQANKVIQKTINNAKYLETQFNEHKQSVQKAEYAQQAEVIEVVKDDIAFGQEKMINANIYFLSYGNSSAECSNNVYLLKEMIKQENMVYNPLNFRQKDFFGSIIPNGFDKNILDDSIILPARSLASGFPFLNSVQIDKTGCILGINSNDNPVVLDINLRNNERINSNGLVLGNTGSGKTTTVKKILNNHLANDGIAFVLDPEQDYIHLTKYYDGKIIDAANGNKARINPLQILLNENDENDENINNNLISSHISLLMQWFKLLDLPFNNDQFEVLKSSLIELYREWGLFEKDLYKLKPTDYPIFTDLVEFLLNKIDKLKSLKVRKEKDNSVIARSKDITNISYCSNLIEIQKWILENFMNGGVYDSLYNGYSTLKIGNDSIVNFDVKNLLAIANPKRKVAQMLLIIAYIQNAINLNGYSQNPKKALLIVDEAHLFIDAKYPDVLIFLSQMSKRIRKRSGGVWITTQNPSDFIATEEISRYTRSLMENTQYTIIQSLKPNDAEAIVNMYKNTPNPITEAEKNFIQQDKRGQMLLIVSNKQRQCLDVIVLDEEFNAIGVSPTDIFTDDKIDWNITFDSFDLEALAKKIKEQEENDIVSIDEDNI